MMHQRIEGQAGAAVVAAERWCILRTSISRTLPLAEVVAAANRKATCATQRASLCHGAAADHGRGDGAHSPGHRIC
jgi:hypothetical protein